MIRIAIFMLLLSAHAVAQEVPSGLGHPPQGQKHWYEPFCCSQKDCEPLPYSAVTMEATGYRVRYLASSGLKVNEVVPYEKVRPSKDGQNHGCASPVRFFCLYVSANV